MKHRAYPAYKPSGVAWLGEIPQHWEPKRVSFIFIKANAGEVIDKSYWGEGHELLFTCDRNPMPSDFAVFPMAKRTSERDLLLTRNGTPYVHKPPAHAIYSNVVQRIRLKDGIDRDFCANALGAACLSLRGYGVSIESLNFGMWKSLQVVLPTIEEQRAIASFLDRETARIDALIEKKQRQIELLQEKRSALISHAVTKGLDPDAKMKDSGIEWLGEIPAHWEVKSIRKIAKTVKTGGTPSGAEEMHFDQNGFDWYTPSDFNEDVTLSGSSRRLSEIGKKEVRVFPAMTVMMVGIGATIGKVALSRELSSCNQQINAIVCNSKMTPKFLTYFLRIMREYIFRCGKFTTLPIINQEDTKALAITCPPINEQNDIVSVLDKETERTGALIGKIQISIDKLREYRTALISAAVTGKIDVRKEVS